jgi:hypothetical protein
MTIAGAMARPEGQPIASAVRAIANAVVDTLAHFGVTNIAPDHRAEGVGGVEGEECGVVVCSRERELISRSKKNPLWRFYERPIGSEQENRARVA